MNELDLKRLFASNLDRYLNLANKTKEDLANALKTPPSTLSDWTKGRKFPRADALCSIASFLNITVADLVEDKSKTKSAALRVPLYDRVFSQGHATIKDDVVLPQNVEADFAIQYINDGRLGRIYYGDIVYFRKQSKVNNGEIAAVVISGLVEIKRIRSIPNVLILESDDPQFDPIVLTGQKTKEIRILGKAVAFTGMFQ